MQQLKDTYGICGGNGGTGHHMFRAIFEKCIALRPDLCEFEKVLPQLLFKASTDFGNSISPGKGLIETKHRGALKNAKKYSGLFGLSAYDTHGDLLAIVLSRMKEIASSMGDKEKLVILNTQDDDKAGMLSYPNFDGPNRNVHNPDLHVLASVAEAAGIDFRIIVLQRSAEAAYRSFHRRFHTEASLMGMVTSASVLYAQMTQVAAGFYNCISYDKIGTINDRDRDTFATFLHPALQGALVKDMLKVVVSRSGTAGTSSAQAQGMGDEKASNTSISYHLVRYQSLLDKIDSLCKKGRI